MMPAPYLLRPLLLLVLFAVALSGCDRCGAADDQPPPWLARGEVAPYELAFPGTWRPERPESINPHAEIAASRDDQFFLLVIPQILPTFPRPDVFEFQQTALHRLQDSVDDFIVHRQGPVELDGVAGLSVFAQGQLQDQSIRYLTSYIIHDGIGFQIIAFCDLADEDTLIHDVELILSNWRFVPTEQDPAPEPIQEN